MANLSTPMPGVEPRPQFEEMMLDYLLYIKTTLVTMDSRLGAMEDKLGAMDRKLGAIDSKLGAMDRKLGGMAQEMRSLNRRTEAVCSVLFSWFPV
jgi:hypothetical protein